MIAGNLRRWNPPTRLAVIAVLLAATTALAEPLRVTVATVEHQHWVETLPLTGTLTAPRDSALSPQVAGQVVAVNIDAGDRVESGDVLFELDRTLARLTLEQLRAELEAAQGQRAEAQRVLDERKPLAADGIIPSTEMEAARAQARIRAAEVARLQARITEQQERLKRHAVVAPFAGVVRARFAELGEWVDTETPVAELVATDVLRLDVQAPQEYYPRIGKGTAVTVRPDALAGGAIEAKVSVRVPISDPTTRSFLLRIRLDNSDGRLAPGMSARALFALKSDAPVLVLPRDATVRGVDGGLRVWLLEDGDQGPTVTQRRVTVGRADAGLVEILSGLEAGARVVLRGNESLANGERVMPVEGS